MAQISEQELKTYSIQFLIKMYKEYPQKFGQINLLDKEELIKHIMLQEYWSIKENKNKNKINNQKKIEKKEKSVSPPPLSSPSPSPSPSPPSSLNNKFNFIINSESESESDDNWLWNEIKSFK